jgi:hypothetical protein
VEKINYINAKNQKIMGRKAAHSGMSPKDRSINLMDKFIARNDRRNRDNPIVSAIRKDPNIPISMWPLKDQIEYWETRSDTDRFNDKYPSYSYWIESVEKLINVHPTYFSDRTYSMKAELVAMYESKTAPKDTVTHLRKLGIY